MRALVLLLACGLCVGVAAPASAQWIRVGALPARDVFSVRSRVDTIVASVDTAVFVSTDAGATWRRSSRPVAEVTLISAVLMLNHRLYAGTFGQGVFVSDNLGSTWQAFNQGLVGGSFDAQLDISDFEVRGDSLLVGTAGAGVFVRRLGDIDTGIPSVMRSSRTRRRTCPISLSATRGCSPAPASTVRRSIATPAPWTGRSARLQMDHSSRVLRPCPRCGPGADGWSAPTRESS